VEVVGVGNDSMMRVFVWYLRPASLAMSLAPRSCRVLVLVIMVKAFWTRDGGAAVEYH
jgi:hypothetical protein